MIACENIDLLKYQNELRVRQTNMVRQIFDSTRKKWLIFTPEEMVRQLLIEYLRNELHFSNNRISLERGFNVNGLYRRYDLAIYDAALTPQILIECKASHIPITQATFDQIFQYNSVLKIPYLVVTNGRQTYCLHVSLDDSEKDKYEFLTEIPTLN